MKTKGVIRGMTIEMETLTDFPDGQVVVVEISPLKAPRYDSMQPGSVPR